MKLRVLITSRKGLLDPQGEAIFHALKELGYGQVKEARQGKIIDLTIADNQDETQTIEAVEKMCKTLLVNDIMEDAEITILPSSPDDRA